MMKKPRHPFYVQLKKEAGLSSFSRGSLHTVNIRWGVVRESYSGHFLDMTSVFTPPPRLCIPLSSHGVKALGWIHGCRISEFMEIPCYVLLQDSTFSLNLYLEIYFQRLLPRFCEAHHIYVPAPE